MSIIKITERIEYFDRKDSIFRYPCPLKEEQYYTSHTKEVRLLGVLICKKVTNRAFAESPKESPSRE